MRVVGSRVAWLSRFVGINAVKNLCDGTRKVFRVGTLLGRRKSSAFVFHLSYLREKFRGLGSDLRDSG